MKTKKTHAKRKLKTKLIIFAIIFVILGSFALGTGIVFTGNDFAMTTLISHNTEKAYEDCIDADDDIYNFTYFDTTVTVTQKAIEGEYESIVIWHIKAIKNYDNTYNFIATTTVNYAQIIEVTLFYQNGIVYCLNRYPEHNTESKQKVPVSSPTQYFLYYQSVQPQIYSCMFPTSANPIVPTNQFETIKTSMSLSIWPLQIAQNYQISYTTEQTTSYLISYSGRILERTYSNVSYGVKETIKIQYHTDNKIFSLDYPGDLNTY